MFGVSLMVKVVCGEIFFYFSGVLSFVRCATWDDPCAIDIDYFGHQSVELRPA